MKSFYQLYNQLKFEEPVKYNFANYMERPINGTEENNVYELTPVTDEDMARYAEKDVLDWYKKHGKNTTKLGKPFTDEEFKKFHGQIW